MEASFGTRLRQQRERRGIELAAIAGQTKIKRSLLEALERDDLKYWPTGIFRRSWVRNYAQAIGADADAVVRELRALYPEEEVSVEDRKSTRLNSSHLVISYAVFCLKKKKESPEHEYCAQLPTYR